MGGLVGRQSAGGDAGQFATKLSPQQEAQFQGWVKQNNIPFDPSAHADYDMRGFWQAQQSGDPNAKRATNLHFPDTYKTPYHQSFSNESMYATPNAPHWEGEQLFGTVPRPQIPGLDTPAPSLQQRLKAFYGK